MSAETARPVNPHAGPQAGTVTFLFTDIEGSTRLLQELGDQYADSLLEQRRILRGAFTAWAGREIDTAGDSFFVAFDRARDAVEAAVTAQRGLAQHSWPGGRTVRVRMGVHTGEPSVSAGSYVGLDVHRAARICAAGHGGQILVSQTTCELVQHSLPEGVSLRDLGQHQLKDLPQPEHLYQVIIPNLVSDFPPLRTVPSRTGTLPAPPNELIGREEEVEALKQLLLREAVRVITLTGPGGTGKSRLALEIAGGLAADFADGVYFVGLGALGDPDLVASSIAMALGLRENPARSVVESLEDSLRGKHVLLVLDNFEQIVAAAPVLAALLTACGRLKVLVTSRAVLHLSGEQEYPVPPLRLPGPGPLPGPGVLERYPAIALFVQRARAVKPGFQLTGDNAVAVARICGQLDGLPLAIELAAARVKLLSPQAMLERLSSRLDFLKGGARDAPARHQTLRQAIAWSYDLLTEDEKAFFRRLSVFTGGCTLEAAERVCSAAGGMQADALDAVAALVDKSLLRLDAGPGEEPRFVMLETIREYGLERLGASGDGDATRRAHATFFLDLAEQAEVELTGPRQPLWLDRLEADHNNLRAALSWVEEQGKIEFGLRLGAALWRFWVTRGHMLEGRQRLQQLLALPGGAARTSARARVLHGLGTIIHEISDYAQARPLLEESLSIWRELGDRRGMAAELNSLGWIDFEVGDFDAAQSLSQEALLLNRELGEKRGVAVALFNLGMVAFLQSDYPVALSLFQESLALRREIGDRRGCAYVQVSLGWLERERGNHDQAAALLGEALVVFRELMDKQLMSWTLAHQGVVAYDLGEYDRAQGLLEESLALGREVGNKVIIAFALSYLGDILRSQGRVPLALPLLDESIFLFREIGSGYGLPPVLRSRADTVLTQREFDRASAVYRESLMMWSKLGGRRGIAECLEGTAGLALAQGEPERSARLYAAAEAIRQNIGAPRPPRGREAYERDLATIRTGLGEEAFAAAWKAGQALTLDQACEMARLG